MQLDPGGTAVADPADLASRSALASRSVNRRHHRRAGIRTRFKHGLHHRHPGGTTGTTGATVATVIRARSPHAPAGAAAGVRACAVRAAPRRSLPPSPPSLPPSPLASSSRSRPCPPRPPHAPRRPPPLLLQPRREPPHRRLHTDDFVREPPSAGPSFHPQRVHDPSRHHPLASRSVRSALRPHQIQARLRPGRSDPPPYALAAVHAHRVPRLERGAPLRRVRRAQHTHVSLLHGTHSSLLPPAENGSTGHEMLSLPS